jgi:hypothetical protein
MRLQSLDALRSVAPLTGVFCHRLSIIPEMYETLGCRGVPFAESSSVLALALTVAPPSLLWPGRDAVAPAIRLGRCIAARPEARGPSRPAPASAHTAPTAMDSSASPVSAA